MLHVALLGNLGGDPELRYTATGTKLATFTVAVNQVRRGPDGERQENTEWFRIRVAGPRSEYAQRFTKGQRVMVMGRLTISHYQGRDGEPKTGFDVWADEVESFVPRVRDAEPLEGDGDAAEPALVGVSSLADAPSTASANGGGTANGGNGRAKRGSQGASAAAAELEDLPF
jgi:single-strand DNA-binding protein